MFKLETPILEASSDVRDRVQQVKALLPVLGELPTALSTAEGSELNGPMAVGVIGGVITSTIRTLVVVPVLYVWIDRFTMGRRQEGAHALHEEPKSAREPATSASPAAASS